jgi:hypothetical protein
VRVRGEDDPTGWIVVAKLSVPSTAPFDIIDLARTLPSFPNHPTADQLYTDQKFEAYRALGHHLGERALDLADRISWYRARGHTVADAVDLATRVALEKAPVPEVQDDKAKAAATPGTAGT